MLSQVTANQGIVGGKIYGFRFRASNRQGWGSYSDIGYFKAANVPDQMIPVVTTLAATKI
jgi:hypothetical protein